MNTPVVTGWGYLGSGQVPTVTPYVYQEDGTSTTIYQLQETTVSVYGPTYGLDGFFYVPMGSGMTPANTGMTPANNGLHQPQKQTQQPPQHAMSCGAALGVLGIGAVTTGAVIAGAIYLPELDPEIYAGLEGVINIMHLSIVPVAPLLVLSEGVKASLQNCGP